jgi:hypothetical protein
MSTKVVVQKPERSTYSPLDFIGWRESGSLVLVPKFQRRDVWTLPARSFLIDTLIRGFPVPPVYLRVTQSEDRTKLIREVVDGQQRISAMLGYVDNKYALSRSLDAPYAGKRFSELTISEQDAIREYSFICEVMHGVSDADVLEMFARLNLYSVQLNAQELRNGRYFGYFKRSAYSLAHEHLETWRRNHVFTERSIARMLEVELTSELMIAQIAGLQDKKKSIGGFYKEFDHEFPLRAQVESQFRSALDMIDGAMGDSLPESEFRRPPLFYSLFCAVYHHAFGLHDQGLPTPQRHLAERQNRGLHEAVMELSDEIRAARDGEPPQSAYVKFVNACLRQTDNIQPRQTRFEVLYKRAF